MQVPKLCTDLDLDLLYILISGTYSKFAQKNNFLALSVCSPQTCSFFAVWIHTASTLITSGTHTDGGAVTRKPGSAWLEGIPEISMVFLFYARALAAGLPCQDHVYKTTDGLFRFHNKNFDEIRCKMDSTENPRSFEKYATTP